MTMVCIVLTSKVKLIKLRKVCN